MIEFELPWFPKELNPNQKRLHPAKRNKIIQQYKHDCYYSIKATGIQKKIISITRNMPLAIIFYPPCNRRRDLDNCYAAIKAGLDGVADAFKIDDSTFRPVLLDFGEKYKSGKIILRVGSDAILKELRR